jgi:hypothetical protein
VRIGDESKGKPEFEGLFGPGIYGFFGEYRWLSNFYGFSIEYNGNKFRSTEHAYQAAKCLDPNDINLFSGCTMAEAKLYGRKVARRPDWEQAKDGVMLDVLRIKYMNPELKQKLIDTNGLYLEETNWWGDQYWGVCEGKGLNKLGKLIMRVRDEIDSGQLHG